MDTSEPACYFIYMLPVKEEIKKVIIKGLIVAASRRIGGYILKLCWSSRKRIINKIFNELGEIKERLEGIISSNDSEIDENDIKWIITRGLFYKWLITEKLKDVVQNRNSKGNIKEKNALNILSFILSATEGFDFLKSIIENTENINWEIRKNAVLSIENILNKENIQDNKEFIKVKKDIMELLKQLIDGRYEGKYIKCAIKCSKYFEDDEILLRLLINIFNTKDQIDEVAIDSLNSICSELKEGIPKFFYHYAKLILLINENPKIVNSMIEILHGQKGSSSAREVIEFMIDNGRFSKDDKKGTWAEINSVLSKVGD